MIYDSMDYLIIASTQLVGMSAFTRRVTSGVTYAYDFLTYFSKFAFFYLGLSCIYSIA